MATTIVSVRSNTPKISVKKNENINRVIVSNIAGSIIIDGGGNEYMYKVVNETKEIYFNSDFNAYYIKTTYIPEGDVIGLKYSLNGVDYNIDIDKVNVVSSNVLVFESPNDITTLKANVSYMRLTSIKTSGNVEITSDTLNALLSPIDGYKTSTELTNNTLQKPFNDVQEKITKIVNLLSN